MFLRCPHLIPQHGGFPRIRGDVPKPYIKYAAPELFSPHTRGCSDVFFGNVFEGEFSPHTRGCSDPRLWDLDSAAVFPAYAGMFLLPLRRLVQHTCFPRIRGDVPAAPKASRAAYMFSPHTRGCSQCDRFGGARGIVFPAYAGMFLNPALTGDDHASFPRIRGDVPISAIRGGHVSVFSPHTRGCSESDRQLDAIAPVFPAYAGMFLKPILRHL